MTDSDKISLYLQNKFEDLEITAPYTIEEIVKYFEVNYLIPLKAHNFQLYQLLDKINISLRNGGYSSHEELGKLYEETNLILNK